MNKKLTVGIVLLLLALELLVAYLLNLREGWQRFAVAGVMLATLIGAYLVTRKGESINDKIRPR